MSGPVFATCWDFLLSQVVIGVDRNSGVFSGTEPTPGRQMVCVWSDLELATDALHVESWELRPIAMRDLVTILPAGVGVVVDPERPTGMTASPSYVARLKPLVTAFPQGSEVRLAPWEVPHLLCDRLVDSVFFGYTVDDSPVLGCVAPTSATTRSVEAVLSEWGTPADLGVPVIRVIAWTELPAQVRDALAPARRRRRLWRR